MGELKSTFLEAIMYTCTLKLKNIWLTRQENLYKGYLKLATEPLELDSVYIRDTTKSSSLASLDLAPSISKEGKSECERNYRFDSKPLSVAQLRNHTILSEWDCAEDFKCFNICII